MKVWGNEGGQLYRANGLGDPWYLLLLALPLIVEQRSGGLRVREMSRRVVRHGVCSRRESGVSGEDEI